MRANECLNSLEGVGWRWLSRPTAGYGRGLRDALVARASMLTAYITSLGTLVSQECAAQRTLTHHLAWRQHSTVLAAHILHAQKDAGSLV